MSDCEKAFRLRQRRWCACVFGRLLWLTCALALALAACACGPSPAEKAGRPQTRRVTVATTPQPASAPIFIADEKGFFEAEGIECKLVMYSASNNALESLLDGGADFATAPETPLASAALSDRRYSILATIARVNSAATIVARKDRGIRGPQDLIGKRVGAAAGTMGEFYLHIYLSIFRIAPERVEIVRLLPWEIVPAIVRGDVDAVSTWFPYEYEAARSLKENAIVFDEPGLYTMSWTLVTTPRIATEETDVAARFLRALINATEYIEEHPADARAILARRSSVEVGAVTRKWDDYRWSVRLDQSLLFELDDAALWISNGVSETPVFDTYIESSVLRSVAPGSVTIIEERP